MWGVERKFEGKRNQEREVEACYGKEKTWNLMEENRVGRGEDWECKMLCDSWKGFVNVFLIFLFTTSPGLPGENEGEEKDRE